MQQTKLRNLLHLTAKSLLLLGIFFLFFRLELYSIINSIYGAKFSVSLPGYLLRSLPGDLLAVLFLQLLLLPLFIIPFRRTAFTLYGVFTLLLTVFILGMLCQFEAFEVPFDTSLLGTGLNTYFSELVTSALHEIPARLLLPTAMLLLLSVFLTVQHYRHPRQTFHRDHFGPFKRILLASIFLLLFIPVFAHQFSLPQRGTRGKLPPLRDLASNPVLELIDPDDKPQQHTATAIKSVDLSNFAFGLDTDSLEIRRRHPRLQLPRKKYNIILYFFESTTVQYIGQKINGRSITPTWDKLRRNSFVGHNHYAQAPLSVNALFSVLASAYDHPGKIWVPMNYPNIKAKTVIEHLKQHGYRTAALHSGDLRNFGHDTYLRHRGLDLMMDMKDFYRLGYRKATVNSVDDRLLIKPSVSFAAKAKASGKPFFLALFPMLPHHPYRIPGTNHEFIMKAYRTETNRNMKKQLFYYNSLLYADLVLNDFLKALDKQGLLKNTLVFIFADHGEAFYQHRGNFLHSLRVYDENTHVPFLIYNKELFKKPHHYRGVSRHVDIAPTVLDATGLSRDTEMEGVSLFSTHNQKLAYLHANWRKNYVGVRDGRWKYIVKTSTMQEELYDLQADPKELTNAARRYPAITKRYREYCLQAEKYKRLYFRKRQLR